MTKIEIPDQIAPILEAKAAAEGLTLTEWIQKLATQTEDSSQNQADNAASCKP